MAGSPRDMVSLSYDALYGSYTRGKKNADSLSSVYVLITCSNGNTLAVLG